MANIIICLDCDYRDNARNFEVNLVSLEDAGEALAEAQKDLAESYGKDNEALAKVCSKLNDKVSMLEGKLAKVQECKADLENMKAHWDLDRKAGYNVNEELYIVVAKLLASLEEGDKK